MIRNDMWRMWSCVRLFLVIHLVVLSASCNPFIPPYSLRLGSLSSDGDLVLTIPLCKWQIDDDNAIDITLVHRQEYIEYGDRRSVFDLTPFQTALYRNGRYSWIWERPGGGVLHFRTSSRDSVAEGNTKSRVRVYSNGGVKLRQNIRDNIETIDDDGWILTYRNGSLISIATPAGRRLNVVSDGRCVVGVSEGGVALLRIDWSNGLRVLPDYLRLGDRTVLLSRADNDGLLKRIFDAETLTVEFGYDKSGLLANIWDHANGVCQKFTWRENPSFSRGDSIYKLPASLASAGGDLFEYKVAGGVHNLRWISSSGLIRKMDIGTRYGRVVWISEE